MYHRIVLIVLAWMLLSCDSQQQQPEITTLIEAAEQGELQKMDDFLTGEQLVNMRDACLWTPLMKAANNGHYQAVKKLLNKGARVDLVDKGGYSAMMLAASNNFSQVVELLLNHGADVNRIERTHGWTALIWAAKRGHKESVEVLLSHDANIEIRDDEDMTALQYARQHDFLEIVSLLESLM